MVTWIFFSEKGLGLLFYIIIRPFEKKMKSKVRKLKLFRELSQDFILCWIEMNWDICMNEGICCLTFDSLVLLKNQWNVKSSGFAETLQGMSILSPRLSPNSCGWLVHTGESEYNTMNVNWTGQQQLLF